MNKVLALSALAIAASVSSNAFAQSNDTNETTQIEPIIVSAGISPVAADEYGRSYTVITRRDIEERGYATVQQALEAQPGISINGDAPSSRQIRIRGGEGNHTLILIDGVRAAAGDNEYILRGLDASYIERIEVLRGPQSVPFGTDASTGVINVVTREAGDGWGYGGSVEFGEGDRESAYLSHGTNRARFALNVSNVNDRGIDYSESGGDRDGTLWESASAKAELELTKDTQAGFSLRYANAFYQLDDYDSTATDVDGYVVESDSNTDRTERAASVYVGHSSFNGSVNHRIRFDRSTQEDQTDSRQFGPSSSNFRTDVANYRVQLAVDRQDIAISDQLLSVLLERREDTDRDGEGRRENNSAAMEYRGWFTNSASIQAGVRRDENSEFADETTWNVAGSYYLRNGVRWHSSAGRAVVNPAFADKFGGEFQPANPDIEPEENAGYDIGVEIPLLQGAGFIDVTYFNETLDNKIDFDENFKSVNIEGESDREGVEFTASFTPRDSLDVTLNYTYIDATNPDDETETRRPRNEAGLNATWKLPDGATILSGNLRHVRGLYDNQFWSGGETGARLPDFTVVDFAASHAITDQIELTARITNAFDEEYSEVWAYATRGRAGFVGLRASW